MAHTVCYLHIALLLTGLSWVLAIPVVGWYLEQRVLWVHSMVNLSSISFRRRLFLICTTPASNLSIKLSNKPTNYGTVNLNEFWNCRCVRATATLPLNWCISPADNVSNALQFLCDFAIPETCTARCRMFLKTSRDQNKPPVQDSQSSCWPRLTTALEKTAHTNRQI